MLPVKKRVGQDGRIAIGKQKGAVEAAAGILKDQTELVEEMLRIRADEDDRPGVTLE